MTRLVAVLGGLAGLLLLAGGLTSVWTDPTYTLAGQLAASGGIFAITAFFVGMICVMLELD